MPTVIAVRHVAFEDLDAFGPILGRQGYSIEYRDAPVDDLTAPDIAAADLLIVLGGPIGVYEDAAYPFLLDEIKLVEARLARGRPVLGICLGSQIMARALGSRVYATGRKEIGWSPDVAVLHWHGDTFDLPAGAQHLASTAQTPNQAFAWARHGLALQFHLEATVRGLERWYVGHACEIASTAGLSVDLLRRQAADGSPRLVAPAQAVVERWLAGLAA
jgi:GMP synthase (glutamine-hydrolysing)